MNQPITAKLAVLLMICGQVVAHPAPLYAAPAADSRPTSGLLSSRNHASAADVALDSQGQLHGQVLDPQGQPVSQVPVILEGNGVPRLNSVTDGEGQFQLKLDRGGVYRLQAAGGTAICRVWSFQAAPPSAGRSALIVAGAPNIRGQGSPLYGWISEHPWCFYTVLATAIAVPIVVVSANHDSSS
jgi:hypothetical protein